MEDNNDLVAPEERSSQTLRPRGRRDEPDRVTVEVQADRDRHFHNTRWRKHRTIRRARRPELKRPPRDVYCAAYPAYEHGPRRGAVWAVALRTLRT